MNETDALLVLTHCPSLGPKRIAQLCNHFGSAHAAVQARGEADGIKLPEKAQLYLSEWQKQDSWKQDLDAVQRSGVTLIGKQEAAYPARLRSIPDAPPLLYVWGSLPQTERSVAVIGTRSPSRYGLEMAHTLSRDLAARGSTVVSGLARGIDTAAHCGALETGQTVAVLGCGLSHIYPKENAQLAAHIAQGGAVVSELSMRTPPDRMHFPKRNRIVSGIVQGALLIEAPERSGAMITMSKALEQGRKLYAIPGRADVPSFAGNHALLKSGQAALTTTASDICGIDDPVISGANSASKHQLSAEEQHLFDQLSEEESHIDQLASCVDLPVSKLNVLLMKLILKNLVTEYPGKLFKRRSAVLR